jgi:hypothetical protein
VQGLLALSLSPPPQRGMRLSLSPPFRASTNSATLLALRRQGRQMEPPENISIFNIVTGVVLDRLYFQFPVARDVRMYELRQEIIRITAIIWGDGEAGLSESLQATNQADHVCRFLDAEGLARSEAHEPRSRNAQRARDSRAAASRCDCFPCHGKHYASGEVGARHFGHRDGLNR